MIELGMSPEDANIQILAILNKLNPEEFEADPKTSGFIYKYKDRTLSPFDYEIYIGRLSQKSNDAIIRVESSNRGQEKVWKQIFEAELLRNPPTEDMKRLEKKSHLISQGLNLVTPAFSVMYNAYDSPLLSSRDAFWSSTFYLIADIILVGGAYIYASDKAPRKSLYDNLLLRSGPPELHKGPDAGAILGALAITRLYRMIGALEDTAAHNRLAQFEYSFNF